jgi:hypothetical protein
MPAIGDRLDTLLDDVPFDMHGFGGGKASTDNADLIEFKTYAIAVLQQHNMPVEMLIHQNRHYWRTFVNDRTLRRLYESAYPPQSR